LAGPQDTVRQEGAVLRRKHSDILGRDVDELRLRIEKDEAREQPAVGHNLGHSEIFMGWILYQAGSQLEHMYHQLAVYGSLPRWCK
jgi:hypothetical protein